MENKRTINPFVLGIVVFVIIVLAVLAYILYGIFRPNPLGKEIKIDNFSHYFKNVPQETVDGIFANLYAVVDMNTEDSSIIPTSGAFVRDGSAQSNYDKDANINYGSFIVDIPAIKQSYSAKYDWSNDSNNINLSGYAALYTCLPESELLYGDFGCKDQNTGSESDVPICNKLPLGVSEYDVASRTSRTYSISCYFEDKDKAKILINDFSGGNYENALDKIRELGFDPADYVIEYNDQGGSFSN